MNRLTACCRVQTVRARSSDGERVTAYVVSTLYCGQGIPQSSISGPCVVINALIIQSLDLATACRYLVLWLKSRCLLSKKSGALTHCPCLFFFVSYKQVLIYIRQPHSNFSRQFSCHCYLDLFDPWNATDTLCPAYKVEDLGFSIVCILMVTTTKVCGIDSQEQGSVINFVNSSLAGALIQPERSRDHGGIFNEIRLIFPLHLVEGNHAGSRKNLSEMCWLLLIEKNLYMEKKLAAVIT